jgi:CBS domain containing-hemolysin-like protein
MMIAILLAALLLTAFCSGSETAFSAASRIRAGVGRREGKHRSGTVLRLLESPELFLTTTLVGTNIGMVLASSVAIAMTRPLGETWTEPVTVGFMTIFILIFAEFIPKQLFFVRRDTIVYPLAPFLMILRGVFFPLLFLANGLARLIVGRKRDFRFIESREEVRSFLVSSGTAAGLSASRILDLGSATAELYMQELDDCPSVRLGAGYDKALSEVLRTGSEFLLVWESDGSTLLGYVRTSVLVRHSGPWNLQKVTEGLPYFERTAVPGRLIYELRRAKAPAGVVLDRNRQPEGIVTIERLVDGILGLSSGS